MAVTYSAKGTTFPSFTIGKKGATIHQGIVAPANIVGVEGDIYVQAGSAPALWQKVAGVWNKIGNFGSKIFTGTTSVETDEVANHITMNADGARIIEILKGAAIAGEKIEISSQGGAVRFETKDDTGQDSVDVEFDLQGQGVFKIISEADSAIRTENGESITIEPGTTANDAGTANIRGGATTKAAARGGNVLLAPGTGPAGMGQVLAPAGYIPTDPNSFVTLSTVGGGGDGAVSSVNAKTGAVVLSASDVGAATAAQGALADTAVQGSTVSVDMDADTIVKRDANGAITVASPGEEDHAANKKYVDDLFAAVTQDGILEQFSDLARGTNLTGLTLVNDRLVASDTFLAAFGKLQGQIDDRVLTPGVPDGIASLDSNGKVPMSQMPVNTMIYQGQWNAATNTPELSDSNPDVPGHYYRCDVPGTVDFGDGDIEFNIGDMAICRGLDGKWTKMISSDDVYSVNSKKGDIVLTANDIIYKEEITVKQALDSLGSRMWAHGSTAANSSGIHLDINGVRVGFRYQSSNNTRAYIVATGANKVIDFRRLSIYNAAVEQQNWDNQTLTTTEIVVDSTIYSTSQETPIWSLRVDGQVWRISAFISGSGSRATMWAECVAP